MTQKCTEQDDRLSGRIRLQELLVWLLFSAIYAVFYWAIPLRAPIFPEYPLSGVIALHVCAIVTALLIGIAGTLNNKNLERDQ